MAFLSRRKYPNIMAAVTIHSDFGAKEDKFCQCSRFSLSSVQLRSVTQSCPTLCDPMNCSTPGYPVHHQHPELAQTHVHRVSDAISSSVVPFSCLQFFSASGSFQMNQFFSSGGQNIGNTMVKKTTVFLPAWNLQSWVFFGRTDAKAEIPILWPPHAKS